MASERKRSLTIAVDTGVVSTTNALTLVVGLRHLGSAESVNFALVMLYLAMAVGLARATLLSPALTTGADRGAEVKIPIRWALQIGLGPALATGATIGIATGGDLATVAICATAASVALTQDALRYVLLSKRDSSSLLVSDLTWLAAVIPAIVVISPATWRATILIWTGGGLLAISASLSGAIRPAKHGEFARLSETWHYGRWSGLDAAVSGVSALLPFLAVANGVDPERVAVYRVLQTALGPLNILSAAALVIKGTSSHRVAANVHKSAAVARRTSVKAGLAALPLLLTALPTMIWLSGFNLTSDIIFPIVVTLYAGVLGAATIPLSSTTAAIGGQKYGVPVRFAVLAFSLIASTLGMRASDSFDALGAVTLFSSTAGLIGWHIGLTRTTRARASKQKGS